MAISKEKESLLTAHALREILDYYPISGIFKWRFRTDVRPSTTSRIFGKVAGQTLKRHVIIGVNGKRYVAHRLAWLHFYGEWPKGQIDHIDGDITNNAIANLRIATIKQNSWNTKAMATNKLGLKNISPQGNQYRVMFTTKGNGAIFREYYKSLETAIAIRNLLAPNIYGEYDRRSK